MSGNLPPYSTFQTSNKQQSIMFPKAKSYGNVLNFTPPGFRQSLNVKFPDSRLAVCESCKKNFKTRDMCRVRNAHTDLPWTTAYICLTLDDSCTDENGNYVDKPMICRMVDWRPFCVKKDFDKKTPVCSTCKKTNRTRSFCRDRHRHRHLPWCTVYMMLSTLESVDPSTVVAAPSKPISHAVSSDTEDAKLSSDTVHPGSEDADGNGETYPVPIETPPPCGVKDEASVAESKTSELSDNRSPESVATRVAELGEGDDINDIAESRTMLIKASSEGCVIVWLDNEIVKSTSRRNLSSVFAPHIQYPPYPIPQCSDPTLNHPVAPSIGEQLMPQDASRCSWPAMYPAENMPHSRHFEQAQPSQSQSYVWRQGQSQHPPLMHSFGHYVSAPPRHHHEPQQQQQQQQSHVPMHYVPIIQQSPGPGTAVSGLNTSVSSPASPPVSAGEAAAMQRLEKNSEDTATEARVELRSPQGPPPQTPLAQQQHPQVPFGLRTGSESLHPTRLSHVSLHPPPTSSPSHEDLHHDHQHLYHPHPHQQEQVHQHPLQQQKQQHHHHGQWVAYPSVYYGQIIAEPASHHSSASAELRMTTSVTGMTPDTPRNDGALPGPAYPNNQPAAVSLSPGQRISYPAQEGNGAGNDFAQDHNHKRPRLG